MALKDATARVSKFNKEVKKTDKELFVEEVTPYANEAAKELGIDPKILIAQAGHETGWGKHVARNADGTSSNNLFNIKTTKGWKGDSTKITTHEIENGKSVKQKASFRSYSSYKESFQDYTKFIKENKRYSKAVEAGAKGDSVGYVKEMAKAGYATDTSYASKVLKTAGSIGKGAVIAGAGVAVGAGVYQAGKAISKAIKPSSSSIENASSNIVKSVKSLFTDDKKEQESKNTDNTETSVISAKEKKKIATETEGLTPWQKKVIELLTKIANNSRKVTQTNENDTISVQQALVEKDETEIVKIPVEKEQSWSKTIVKGIVATGVVALPAISLANKNKDNSNQSAEVDIKTPTKQPVKKSIEQPVKKSIEQHVKKIIKQPVTVDNKPTQEKINIKPETKQPIKEKFTKSVNSVVENINKQKQIKEQPSSPTIVKQVQTKNIPQEKEIKPTQKTIVISETNNIEKEMELSPVLLFGDRYSALDDLKSISLSSREYGTGLFRRMT